MKSGPTISIDYAIDTMSLFHVNVTVIDKHMTMESFSVMSTFPLHESTREHSKWNETKISFLFLKVYSVQITLKIFSSLLFLYTGKWISSSAFMIRDNSDRAREKQNLYYDVLTDFLIIYDLNALQIVWKLDSPWNFCFSFSINSD